jgi:ABC-2 type transport system permease protein
VIIVTAGLLQLGLALAVGMTVPEHPVALAVAFTLATFAFIGLGLVIAALADNVPAVQALGQCIFLPMLIIGGVAVPLGSLPDWAQHVSAFFPGRYAVDALQAGVNGGGFAAIRFNLGALGLIGCAAVVAGGALFRWDAQQRFWSGRGKAWLAPVLVAWLAVGLLAEQRDRVKVATPKADAVVAVVVAPSVVTAPVAPAVAVVPPPQPKPVLPPPAPKPQPAWTRITAEDIAKLDFNVPPDQGIVAPIAAEDEEPYDFMIEQVNSVRDKLPAWGPGAEADDVQAVRNILCVAAVPDAIQLPVERFLPRIAFERLQDLYPKDKLVQILTYIALHPEDGLVLDNINDLGIEGAAGDPMQVRERVYLYAIKFVARLTDRFKRPGN